MDFYRALVGCTFLLLFWGQSIGNDVIIRWNEVLTDVLLRDTTYQNPGMASRSMAMTNLAMYDAMNGVNPHHQLFYSYNSAPTQGASADAAALQAGYRVLADIYPDQTAFLQTRRDEILADMSGGVSAGVDFGDHVGRTIVDNRNSDGFMNIVPYTPTESPGRWQPDPLNPDQVAWGPEWGQISTFALPSASGFVAPEMPALTSQAYTDAFNEVKALGAKDSDVRTAEQTQIGLFWAYDRLGMGTPMRMYNCILRTIAADQGNTPEQNARLFAMASTAVADAGIVAWDTKFTYDFWRPVTGIREADSDGNPDTVADATWEPLGAPGGVLDDSTIIPDFTPPFPTYVSGHASFGSALFASLHDFYGTDEISFDVTSDETPGLVRSFDSLHEAMLENGRSRVYLGIHWDFGDLLAQDVGQNVSEYVSTNYFQPVPEPKFGAASLVFLAFGYGRIRRRRTAAGSGG